MDFRARLAALPPPVQPARERPERSPDRGPLPGGPRETPHGSIHVVEASHPPEALYGTARLGTTLSAEAATLGRLALDPRLEGVDPGRLVFLDTETTGLSGGAGTIPFLVGLAWFERGRLEVSQLLLPRPGEEGPLLRAVAERLEWASGVVTYNGKCFDWPLLRTRFVLNRLPPPPGLPHLDLLHCARRVFRRRLPTTRLLDIERHVLGHARDADIPGAEVPEAYFEFLRTGDAGRLGLVVSHNAQDLLALAALLGLLVGAHEERPGFVLAGSDLLGLAQLAVRAGERDRAERFALAAAERGPDEVAVEALELAARLARRRGDSRVAVEALTRAERLAAGLPSAERIHLALAKLYEHRLRDASAALEHARRGVGAESPRSAARRLERLKKRTEKGTGYFSFR